MPTNATTRREFLKQAAAGVTMAALAQDVLASQSAASATGMPTRVLGRTGQRVSILCLGGWHIGAVKDDAEAIRIMHAAIDEGITFFDNAWDYHDGRSEELMGQALAGGKRDKVFLMTKNCERDYEGSKRYLEESLRRLQTDHLDLWQFHEMIYDNDPDWVFDKGGIKAAIEARKAGQGPLHRLHRPQGSAHPPGDARQALRLGYAPDADQRHGCALPQLPEASGTGVPEEERRRDRDEGLRRRVGHRRPGRAVGGRGVSLRLSQPVSSQVIGITSMEQLKQNVALARDFTPMTPAEQTALVARVRDVATDGRFELFKSSQMFDGPVHRRQHGFAT